MLQRHPRCELQCWHAWLLLLQQQGCRRQRWHSRGVLLLLRRLLLAARSDLRQEFVHLLNGQV